MTDIMMFNGLEDDGLTVVDAMVACGLDHNALFQEETQAQRIASEFSVIISQLALMSHSRSNTSRPR